MLEAVDPFLDLRLGLSLFHLKFILGDDRPRVHTFVDKMHRHPEAALAGQTAVTVKFQAQPGNFAGGVFDVRLVSGE